METTITKLDIEFQKKLTDMVGREKSKEVQRLLAQYGVDVVTCVREMEIDLPGLKIVGVSGDGSVARHHPIRQHQFDCKINGESLANIQKIELDPFDYNSGDLFKAKITVIPGITTKTFKPIVVKGDDQ